MMCLECPRGRVAVYRDNTGYLAKGLISGFYMRLLGRLEKTLD